MTNQVTSREIVATVVPKVRLRRDLRNRTRVRCNAGVFVSPSDKSSVGNAGVLIAPNHECSIHKAGAQLKCGCFLPAAGYACVKDCRNLPICDGSVGGTPVKILRDSGCNGVIVRKSLVRPNEFTGRSKSLMMIDRTVLHAHRNVRHIVAHL